VFSRLEALAEVLSDKLMQYLVEQIEVDLDERTLSCVSMIALRYLKIKPKA